MDRKSFIKKGILGSGALLSVPIISIGQDRDNINMEDIKEFVTVGHSNFERTKEIVEAKPLILNCTYQWKRGDFETAVGGACHLGNREIADLLISKGARLDIFNFAFLGYTDLVIKLVSDYPPLLKSPGPHGLTLLHHAKVGKQAALEEWLIGKGLTETHIKVYG
ncbi:MAG: hypothetical protein ABJG78_06735 [Cyclobacteriaceae bacterium]